MKNNKKISILGIIIITAAFLVVRQVLALKKNIKEIKPPTKIDRQFMIKDAYEWITVKALARKYKTSEYEIFKALKITPEKKDENLPLMELGKKYNKSPKEMLHNLKKVIKKHRDVDGIRYE